MNASATFLLIAKLFVVTPVIGLDCVGRSTLEGQSKSQTRQQALQGAVNKFQLNTDHRAQAKVQVWRELRNSGQHLYTWQSAGAEPSPVVGTLMHRRRLSHAWLGLRAY